MYFFAAIVIMAALGNISTPIYPTIDNKIAPDCLLEIILLRTLELCISQNKKTEQNKNLLSNLEKNGYISESSCFRWIWVNMALHNMSKWFYIIHVHERR